MHEGNIRKATISFPWSANARCINADKVHTADAERGEPAIGLLHRKTGQRTEAPKGDTVFHCQNRSAFYPCANLIIRAVSVRSAIQQCHRSSVVVLIETFYAVIECKAPLQDHIMPQTIFAAVSYTHMT